jgi:uncharacterized OsmC-like protein
MGLQTQDFIKSAKALQEQASTQPKGTEQVVELNIGTRLVRNVKVEASFRDNVWYSDESKERGGDGSAPGPLAYFLSAVGLGIITQCSYEAAVRDVEIDEIRIAVKAPLRRSPGSSFETISYETRIRSKTSAETAEEIVRTAVRKSFITNTLKKGVQVTGKIILNDQPLPAVIE